MAGDAAWAYGLGIMFLVLGVAAGVLLSSFLRSGQEDRQELETRLAEAEAELDTYRERVGHHLYETERLMSTLDESYRQLQAHLNESNERLHALRRLEDRSSEHKLTRQAGGTAGAEPAEAQVASAG